VLKDVSKTLVYRLARYTAITLGQVIPERIITRAPSAEIARRPDRSGQPAPYDALDAIMECYVEKNLAIRKSSRAATRKPMYAGWCT